MVGGDAFPLERHIYHGLIVIGNGDMRVGQGNNLNAVYTLGHAVVGVSPLNGFHRMVVIYIGKQLNALYMPFFFPRKG